MIESLESKKFSSIASFIKEISVKGLRDVSTQSSIIVYNRPGMISVKNLMKNVISAASSKIA